MNDVNTHREFELVLNDLKFKREKVPINDYLKPNLDKISLELQRKIDDEIKMIQRKLPVSINRSIFVRQNSKYPQILSALITGVSKTPYEHMCIIFDIYIPHNYPHMPPLIASRVKSTDLNPFIGKNGIVNITLHKVNDDSCVLWDPNKSSLYKLLLYIQNEILVARPYFVNAVAMGLETCDTIKELSTEYDLKIHMIVLSRCLFGLIRNTPQEFEDVIGLYYYFKNDMITKFITKCKQSSKTLKHNEKYKGKDINEWAKLCKKKLKENYIANDTCSQENSDDEMHTVNMDEYDCEYQYDADSDGDYNSDSDKETYAHYKMNYKNDDDNDDAFFKRDYQNAYSNLDLRTGMPNVRLQQELMRANDPDYVSISSEGDSKDGMAEWNRMWDEDWNNRQNNGMNKLDNDEWNNDEWNNDELDNNEWDNNMDAFQDNDEDNEDNNDIYENNIFDDYSSYR